jgi:hypothetical protein
MYPRQRSIPTQMGGSKIGSNAMERNGTQWDDTPMKALNNPP